MALYRNTEAILLLTAPLMTGRRQESADLLNPREYTALARALRAANREPGDLLDAPARLLESYVDVVSPDRLRRLLARGFALSQAAANWQARSIWLISRADSAYPSRLKEQLGELAPPILYGCGSQKLLVGGGLALLFGNTPTGSWERDLRELVSDAAEPVAALISVSPEGGADALDMGLDMGLPTILVLSGNLSRAAISRKYRKGLMEERLVLVSDVDPLEARASRSLAGEIAVGLSDAVLLVRSGGRRSREVELAGRELERRRRPVFVHEESSRRDGVAALRKVGALSWLPASSLVPQQASLAEGEPPLTGVARETRSGSSAADELFGIVRRLLLQTEAARSVDEVATDLGVSRSQARDWLARLVHEGTMERLGRPARYRPSPSRLRLFGDESRQSSS